MTLFPSDGPRAVVTAAASSHTPRIPITYTELPDSWQAALCKAEPSTAAKRVAMLCRIRARNTDRYVTPHPLKARARPIAPRRKVQRSGGFSSKRRLVTHIDDLERTASTATSSVVAPVGSASASHTLAGIVNNSDEEHTGGLEDSQGRKRPCHFFPGGLKDSRRRVLKATRASAFAAPLLPTSSSEHVDIPAAFLPSVPLDTPAGAVVHPDGVVSSFNSKLEFSVLVNKCVSRRRGACDNLLLDLKRKRADDSSYRSCTSRGQTGSSNDTSFSQLVPRSGTSRLVPTSGPAVDVIDVIGTKGADNVDGPVPLASSPATAANCDNHDSVIMTNAVPTVSLSPVLAVLPDATLEPSVTDGFAIGEDTHKHVYADSDAAGRPKVSFPVPNLSGSSWCMHDDAVTDPLHNTPVRNVHTAYRSLFNAALGVDFLHSVDTDVLVSSTAPGDPPHSSEVAAVVHIDSSVVVAAAIPFNRAVTVSSHEGASVPLLGAPVLTVDQVALRPIFRIYRKRKASEVILCRSVLPRLLPPCRSPARKRRAVPIACPVSRRKIAVS